MSECMGWLNVMGVRMHGMVECDGCQKEANSIAVEHSRSNCVVQRFLF